MFLSPSKTACTTTSRSLYSVLSYSGLHIAMAPVPPQTLLSLASHPVPSTSTVSLLPFTLAHDGPARISTFFHPRPYPSPAAKDEEGATTTTTTAHRQAAFRGRRIVSSTLSLPEGYRGLVYSTTAPLPPSATETDSAEVDGEVEERAAKRAKRAAASAAALDKPAAAVEDDESKQADADMSSRRRSPRKSTSAASTRARERAIRLAKEKARRKSAAAGTLPKKGFSLDSDEEDQGGVDMATPTAPGADEKAGEPLLASDIEAPAPTPIALEEAAVIEASETPVLPAESLVEETLAPTTVSIETEDAAAAATPLPVPAPPLRTISTVSVASSSIITSAPRSPSPPPPPSSTAKVEFDSPAAATVVSLSRDEKRLVPSLTFDSIEIWNPDWPLAGGKVTEDDEVGRAVFEWIGLANKVRLLALALIPSERVPDFSLCVYRSMFIDGLMAYCSSVRCRSA